MNILISITNLETGGAQMFVLHLASALAEKHTVYLYDQRPEDRNCLFVKKNVSKKVNIISYASNPLLLKIIWKIKKTIHQLGFNFNLRDWINATHLKYAIKKYRIDVVHSHLALSDYTVCRILKEVKLPVVITLHGDLDAEDQNNILYYSSNIPFIMNRVNAIVYLTHKSIAPFMKYIENTKIDFQNIPNGYNLKSEFSDNNDKESKHFSKEKFGILDGDFVFGMIARGIKEKGWEEAILSYAAIKELLWSVHHIKTHLILAGDGDFLMYLKNKYSNIPNIHFTGNISSPLKMIKLFDTGLLPTYSYSERFPISIIEYLLLNKPVIATRVGEIPTMITGAKGKAGILINLDENGICKVDELKAAMIKLATDKDFHGEKKKICASVIDKFDIRECADRHISLYESIIDLLRKS